MGLKHQADVTRKWYTAVRQVQRHFPKHLPPMFFLTDPDRTPDPGVRIATLPKQCGVIFRHFGASDKYSRATLLSDLCRQEQRPFLIAADPDLAAAVGATGVHWPESRLTSARKWRARFELQTASAHSRAAVLRAERMGMNAVLCSTVFQSNSPSAGRPMGVTKFRLFVGRASLPIYGLGGVCSNTADRIASFSGLSGVSLL